MRTQPEIADRLRGTIDRDIFGFRTEVLLAALDFEHAREFLRDEATADDWPIEDEATFDRGAREYYVFALDKIRHHRGLSALRSVEKLIEYAWVLGRDDVVSAMNSAEYAEYGAPAVKAFGDGFELGWPDEPELVRMAAGLPCSADCFGGCGQ